MKKGEEEEEEEEEVIFKGKNGSRSVENMSVRMCFCYRRIRDVIRTEDVQSYCPDLFLVVRILNLWGINQAVSTAVRRMVQPELQRSTCISRVGQVTQHLILIVQLQCRPIY